MTVTASYQPTTEEIERDLTDDNWFAAWVERAEADEQAIRDGIAQCEAGLSRIEAKVQAYELVYGPEFAAKAMEHLKVCARTKLGLTCLADWNECIARSVEETK